MKKICFVMAEAYPVISGKGNQVGGAELQSWLIANELSKNFDVHFIVKAKKSGEEIKKEIKVHKIEYKHPIIGHIKILKKMHDIKANIYYQRTGGVATIITSMFCFLTGKKFVFHIAGDYQLDVGYPYGKNRFIRWLYRLAIKKAEVIFVQNNIQRKKLKKFGRNGIVIKNLVNTDVNSSEKEDFVLWVGNISNIKSPLTYISLAKELPQHKFLMIGNPADRELSEKVKKEAETTPNLEFLGFKPYIETDEYFKKAKVFVNTSKLEGFPNTFLQAWRYKTPVVSLNVDPDEIICNYELGFHSKTLDAMKRDVSHLMESIELNQRLGNNGKKYVKEKHDIKKVGKKLVKIFMEI